MRAWSHWLLGRILLIVVTFFVATVSVSAKERLVMPYQCTVDGDTLRLTQSSEPISYAILGPRDQRPYTACVEADGHDCRTVMVHQFEMSCAGHRVSWVDVAAGMGEFHESAPMLAGGQLNMILMARRRGSEKLPWQSGPDRARVTLPKGYAPVGEIGARFVLPSTTGTIVVSPDSTSVDSYTNDTRQAEIHQVAVNRPDAAIDDTAFAYAKNDRADEIDVNAVGHKKMSAWNTTVNSNHTLTTSSVEGPGTAFMGYVMFAGVLASLILVGGYSFRRHLPSAFGAIGRHRFALGLGPGGHARQAFTTSMSDAPIPGVRVDQADHATCSRSIGDRQWQPGQSKSTWAALTGHSVNSTGNAFRTFCNVASNSFGQAKAKVFASGAEARQAWFATQRAGRHKSHEPHTPRNAQNRRQYQAPPGSNNGGFDNTHGTHGAGFGDARSASSSHGRTRSDARYSQRDVQYQSGLNVVDVGLRYSEEAVSALGPATQLRDVLTGELKILRQRQSVLRATIADGSATPSRAEATMRRLTVELERIRRIADSAAQSHGSSGAQGGGVAVPQTPGEAYAVLGVNADVTDAALKKIVDGLRMSWHPDMARDHQDREIREARTKQLNIAWDLIQGQRNAQF
ncbi:MAG: hypothetical protein ACRBCJ_06890 [Hyphomicrobiaceae bacterium]